MAGGANATVNESRRPNIMSAAAKRFHPVKARRNKNPAKNPSHAPLANVSNRQAARSRDIAISPNFFFRPIAAKKTSASGKGKEVAR